MQTINSQPPVNLNLTADPSVSAGQFLHGTKVEVKTWAGQAKAWCGYHVSKVKASVSDAAGKVASAVKHFFKEILAGIGAVGILARDAVRANPFTFGAVCFVAGGALTYYFMKQKPAAPAIDASNSGASQPAAAGSADSSLLHEETQLYTKTGADGKTISVKLTAAEYQTRISAGETLMLHAAAQPGGASSSSAAAANTAQTV